MATLRHLLLGTCSLLGLCCLVSAAAVADNYQINASIPYAAPTTPAVINAGLDGTTVNSALQTIAGTCELQNPQSVVSIWRGGTSIGSTTCNGTFSLQIMLVQGPNTLIARTANPSSLYGPDSAPITVTLVLPASPTPPPADPGPQPASAAQEVTATNAGASENLTIATNQPFSVLSSANDVTITVTIGGGKNPYDIALNWGDGSVDNHHLDVAGTYSFSHIYQTPGSYTVHGFVHDVLGAFSEFEYAVVTSHKTPGGSSASNSGGSAGHARNTTDWRTLKPFVLTGSAIILLWIAYFLGVHHAVAKVMENSRAKPQTRPPIIAKPKRKRGKK